MWTVAAASARQARPPTRTKESVPGDRPSFQGKVRKKMISVFLPIVHVTVFLLVLNFKAKTYILKGRFRRRHFISSMKTTREPTSTETV